MPTFIVRNADAIGKLRKVLIGDRGQAVMGSACGAHRARTSCSRVCDLTARSKPGFVRPVRGRCVLAGPAQTADDGADWLTPSGPSPGAAVAALAAGLVAAFFLEQFGQFFEHDAAQLLGVDDGDGAAVIARHVVADAACLYRLVRLERTGGSKDRSIGTAFCKRFIVVAELIGDADQAYLLDRMRHVGQTAKAERNLERVVIYPILSALQHRSCRSRPALSKTSDGRGASEPRSCQDPATDPRCLFLCKPRPHVSSSPNLPRNYARLPLNPKVSTFSHIEPHDIRRYPAQP